MGDIQTFFYLFIEGLTALVIVLVLTGVGVRQLVLMWRSGEQRFTFFIAAAAVFAFFAFTVIATFGVTWGAFYYRG
jgi:ABC-type arginine transport system permease subunit